MIIGALLTEAPQILVHQNQVCISFSSLYQTHLELTLNDFDSAETDLFTSLFSVAPEASATEHRPTPRVRFQDILHPEPSANVTPANRIPDDALSTRAVPPDELDEDDLEDGEIDEEDYDSDIDYKYVDYFW